MSVSCRAISSSAMSKKFKLVEYKLLGTFGLGAGCVHIRLCLGLMWASCIANKRGLSLLTRWAVGGGYPLVQRFLQLRGQRRMISFDIATDKLFELGDQLRVEILKRSLKPLVENVADPELDSVHYRVGLFRGAIREPGSWYHVAEQRALVLAWCCERLNRSSNFRSRTFGVVND